MTTDLNALVTLLEQEAVSWDLQVCPAARHPDAINRNAHAVRRAELLRKAAATITAMNTRAASGGEALVSQPVAPHAANNALSPTVRTTVGAGVDSASLEQRARDAFEEWFAAVEAGDGTIPVPQSIADGQAWHEHIGRRQMAQGAWFEAIRFAALANQQGVGGWQPIETAPKDGTEILLSVAWDGGKVCVVATWEMNGWMDADLRRVEMGSSVVTHWAPIPAHPTAAESP